MHGILRRAGRLQDTSLVIVGDHGEGFELAHERDRVHGGAVYDTQVRLPFIAFGPMARGMPKRVPGVWSDTAIGPTLLEALGLRHRDCRGALPGALDLFGCSVLSSPPYLRTWMRQTACEREECSCTPVAAEARRLSALPMAATSSAAACTHSSSCP